MIFNLIESDLIILLSKVLEIVEPGLSKFRAKFSFELVDTKMFLFCEQFKRDGKADPKELLG